MGSRGLRLDWFGRELVGCSSLSYEAACLSHFCFNGAWCFPIYGFEMRRRKGRVKVRCGSSDNKIRRSGRSMNIPELRMIFAEVWSRSIKVCNTSDPEV